MIRTIIADDDVETLDGLRKVIPWERHGFRVVATAADGKSALTLVRRHRPDLLIADITMPAMDGLTLIRECRRTHPRLKSVVLTCHEDFAYAREALSLGVMDYLLKITLTPQTLTECLRKVRSVIDGEHDAQQAVEGLKQEIDHNRLFVQADFFLSVIEAGRERGAELLARARGLGIGFPGDAWRVLVFYLDDPPPAAARVATAAAEIVDRAFTGEGSTVVVRRADRTVVVIRWYRERPREVDPRLRRTAAAALAEIRESTGVGATCCVSPAGEDVLALGDAVAACAALREGAFYTGSGAVLTRGPEPWGAEGPAYAPHEEALVRLLAAPTEEGITALVRSLRLGFLSTRPAPPAARDLMRRLGVEIAAAANRRGFAPEAARSPADTLDGELAALEAALRAFAARAGRTLPGTARSEIREVLEYIHAHLDQSIHCEAMAARVGLNGSYFSRLFKREVGRSFTDYLMQQRIARSHELLAHTAMPFEEVTWAVGLENVSYFHRMFKKYTGMTPREARRRGATRS